MTSSFRDRKRADALERALQRHSRLLAQGADPDEARALARSGLTGEDIYLFSLAARLPEAAAPMPDPKFADVFAERLRRQKFEPSLSKSLRKLAFRRRPGFAFLPVAAAIVICAALLIPAFRSLPGDPLYSFKRASERTEVFVASGPSEARLRLDLAKERFEEVQGLVERAHVSAMGTGIAAASATDGIDDPRLAKLINDTLAEASREISTAAEIFIASASSTNDYDKLVSVTQTGKKLAENVAADLPVHAQTPALDTVVQFAKIEAEAKAARSGATTEPVLQACATPSPSPTATPAGSPTATPTETPSSSPTESPVAATATPIATPVGTPCITPTPSPTPTATPVPTATTPTASPTTAPAGGNDGSNVQPADDPDSAPAQGADTGLSDAAPNA